MLRKTDTMNYLRDPPNKPTVQTLISWPSTLALLEALMGIGGTYGNIYGYHGNIYGLYGDIYGFMIIQKVTAWDTCEEHKFCIVYAFYPRTLREERGSTDGHFLLLLFFFFHTSRALFSLRYRMVSVRYRKTPWGGLGLLQCMPSCLSCEKGIQRCFSMK